jgi:branched-chain amino acid transport system permease protein
MLLLQLLASGIQTGILYALTAAGFALIFGATRVFHVAHGATFVIAGYAFYETMQLGLWWPLAALFSLAMAVLFGVCMALFIYRPIQRSEGSFFTVFVAAFGVSIVVQSLTQFFFGRGSVTISSPLTQAKEVMAGLYLSPLLAVAIGVASVLFIAVTVFLERRNAGLGLRALSENPGLLQAFGLDAKGLMVLAFALGSALVVPAAILTSISIGIQPSSGARVMLISLAATIVGGIGSLRGAVLAGLLLGVIENIVVTVLATQWSDATGFFVLFAFILLRPNGIFGVAAKR